MDELPAYLEDIRLRHLEDIRLCHDTWKKRQAIYQRLKDKTQE